jgi:hypothetical protein
MKSNLRIRIHHWLIVGKSILLFLLMAPQAGSAAQPVAGQFDHYLVFMATGSIPLGVPHPTVPGCGAGLFCDGDYFQTNIMKRSATEVDIERQKAVDYWKLRFGVDVYDPDLSGRIDFLSMYIDPRGDYRVYTIANKRVPSEGFEIRDGGFVMMVTDPQGITLGGDFSGQLLAAGSMLVYGNYNIAVTNKQGKIKNEMIIWYRSHSPMIANAWGELSINCQVSLDNWQSDNTGSASGLGQPLLVSPENTLDLSWRNVVTFSE